MQRNPGIDLVRLLAAILVVVSHSFLLVGENPLQAISPELSLGRIGLAMFFMISGYLVHQSLARSRRGYLRRRILRIMPALLPAAMLSLLAGALLTTLEPAQYWSSPQTLLYPLRTLMLLTWNQDLPGVLVGLEYPLGGINIPLWTLPVEFICYLLLLPASFLLQKNTAARLFVTIFLLLFFYYSLVWSAEGWGSTANQTIWLVLLFFLGSSLGKAAVLWKNSTRILIAALGLGLMFSGFSALATSLLALGVVLLLAEKSPSCWKKIRAKAGDLSYGIYIFSFPIQQLLVHKITDNPYLLLLATLAAVIPLAALSWRALESRALRLGRS